MKRVILSCLISVVCAAVASATWVAETNSVPLNSLPGGSLIVGDKEFSGFNLDVVTVGGGAFPPDPNTMTVQGVQDVTTGDYGLRFDGVAWNVISYQTIAVNLSFEVSILPGDGNFIKDVWLYLTGAGATGTGEVIANENVWDAFPGGHNIASLNCSAQYNYNHLSDNGSFAPLKEIYIQTKYISVTGGTNGSAYFSEFFQFYSQVPEPATITLVSLAGVIMLRKSHRR
jgi:hypothetical protein